MKSPLSIVVLLLLSNGLLRAQVVAQPASVTLSQEVSVPLTKDGLVIGQSRIPAGTQLKVLGVRADQIVAQYISSTVEVPAAFTDYTRQREARQRTTDAQVAAQAEARRNAPPEFCIIKRDKFSQALSVELANPISLGAGLELKIRSGFSDIKGKRIFTNPMLHFTRSGREWRYLDYHHLVFLLDGKPLNGGDTDHSGSVNSDATVLEQMFASLNSKEFRQLAEAQVAEGKLGSTEFALSYSARAPLREMLSLLTTGRPR